MDVSGLEPACSQDHLRADGLSSEMPTVERAHFAKQSKNVVFAWLFQISQQESQNVATKSSSKSSFSKKKKNRKRNRTSELGSWRSMCPPYGAPFWFQHMLTISEVLETVASSIDFFQSNRCASFCTGLCAHRMRSVSVEAWIRLALNATAREREKHMSQSDLCLFDKLQTPHILLTLYFSSQHQPLYFPKWYVFVHATQNITAFSPHPNRSTSMCLHVIVFE